MNAYGPTSLVADAIRPALRGWLHTGAAVAAIVGAVWLLVIADSPAGYVGASVFAASLIALYVTSAGYHRIAWSDRLRPMVKRLDHSMIWVLIAGTYTPACLAVSLAWGISILSVVWGVAGAGMLLKVIWPDAPRWLGVSLYIALGWTALVGVSELVQEFSPAALTLLALGGAFYTGGAVIYALRRPDPWPRIFGYHEVFHALVIAGSAAHYVFIAAYVL